MSSHDFLILSKLHTVASMPQRKFHLEVTTGLINGMMMNNHKRVILNPDIRHEREMAHAPQLQSTASWCTVHKQKCDTKYSCRVCKVRMCQDPCFFRYVFMVNVFTFTH
ncbi:unnamed protein product, partial [Owenia fusiformis]